MYKCRLFDSPIDEKRRHAKVRLPCFLEQILKGYALMEDIALAVVIRSL